MQYCYGINWSLMWCDGTGRIYLDEILDGRKRNEKWENEKVVVTWLHMIIQVAVNHCINQPSLRLHVYILNNTAGWYFTIAHFLASYKVCMLFYYPLHNLHDVLTTHEPQTFYLSFCMFYLSVRNCCCCCCCFSIYFSYVSISKFICVCFKQNAHTQTHYVGISTELFKILNW